MGLDLTNVGAMDGVDKQIRLLLWVTTVLHSSRVLHALVLLCRDSISSGSLLDTMSAIIEIILPVSFKSLVIVVLCNLVNRRTVSLHSASRCRCILHGCTDVCVLVGQT